MARWKALVNFLLSVVERLFLSLTVEALQGKMCQNSLLLGQHFRGKRSFLGGLFLVDGKLDTFFYLPVKTESSCVQSF